MLDNIAQTTRKRDYCKFWCDRLPKCSFAVFVLFFRWMGVECEAVTHELTQDVNAIQIHHSAQ